MMSAQMKAFFDGTGGHWSKGSLQNKFAGVLISTATPGGGPETTGLTAVTQFTHQGMVRRGCSEEGVQHDDSVLFFRHGGPSKE